MYPEAAESRGGPGADGVCWTSRLLVGEYLATPAVQFGGHWTEQSATVTTVVHVTPL